MTPAEKALTVRLLKLASDEFANHGCNDFNINKFIPAAEQRKFIEAFHEWNGDPEEAAQLKDSDLRYAIPDWALMSYMAYRLTT